MLLPDETGAIAQQPEDSTVFKRVLALYVGFLEQEETPSGEKPQRATVGPRSAPQNPGNDCEKHSI